MEFLFRLFCAFLSITVGYSQTSSTPFGCGQQTYYTAPNGTIYSHLGYDAGHHYGKGLRCTWTIEAPVGWMVELVAEAFELEGSSSSCYRDYIIVYDGPWTNYTRLGTYCGTSFQPMSSTGRFMTILFITNTYTTMNGFKLHYNFTQTPIYSCRNNYYLCGDHRCVPQNYRCDGDDDCGDDTDEHHCPPFTCLPNYFPCAHERKCIQASWLCDGGKDCRDGSDEITANCHGGAWKCGQLNETGTSGVFASPGYPSTNYPNSLSCKYHIYAPNGTKSITLTFATAFHIETDVGCSYDYVSVYSDGNTYKHGPYCGNTPPAKFTIPSSHAIIEFNSDNSDGYQGFRVSWSANS